MSKFVKIPWDIIDNPAIHSNCELGLIVRLARKAEWKEKSATTLKDGTEIFLAPGEMIISERDIAAEAGIHRTTVRRLFERLERAKLCVRRCANQRSSNGTILSWTFLQQDQELNEGCKTELKPSLKPSCVQSSAVSEPSINIDIDSRYQTEDKEESPLPPTGGDEPELFGKSETKPVDAKPVDAKPIKTRKPRNTLAYTPAEMDDFFTEFKSAYPASNLQSPDGGHHWTGARRYFDAAVKAKVDPKALIAAAYRYCSETKTNKRYGTGYTKDAFNWLKERRWEEYNGVHPFPDQTPIRSDLYVLTYGGEETVEEIKRRRAAIGPYV